MKEVYRRERKSEWDSSQEWIMEIEKIIELSTNLENRIEPTKNQSDTMKSTSASSSTMGVVVNVIGKELSQLATMKV